jgi:integrase
MNEIDNYVDFSEHKTKIRSKKKLNDFAQYLSTTINEPVEKINLLRIYLRKDKNNSFEIYLPIDSRLIDEYLSSNTVKGYSWLSLVKGILNSFFKYLYRRYEFPNPMVDCNFNIKKYKKVSRTRTALTRHQVLRFLNAVVTQSEDLFVDLLLFCLLISTGCRINEVLSLKVHQINFNEDTLRLDDTKSNKGRTIVLRPKLGLVLRWYCETNKMKQQDFIFKGEKEGHLTSADALLIYRKFLNFAGLPPFDLHGLRHTFATIMYEEGIDILIIQQLLGHENPETTQEYVHGNTIWNLGVNIESNTRIFKEAYVQYRIRKRNST